MYLVPSVISFIFQSPVRKEIPTNAIVHHQHLRPNAVVNLPQSQHSGFGLLFLARGGLGHLVLGRMRGLSSLLFHQGLLPTETKEKKKGKEK